MESILNFFKRKTVGFYLCCAAALLSVIVAIVYGAAYSGTDYMNGWAVALPIVGAVAFAVMSVFKQTEAYGAVVMGVLDLTGFLLFVQASYLYLSEVFYGGVSAAAFKMMNPAYIVCVLFFLIATVLSNVGIYMKSSKPKVAEQKETQA